MFDDMIKTGKINGHKIYLDGMFYYVKINGIIYVLDEDELGI